jgi:hypothetical protein
LGVGIWTRTVLGHVERRERTGRDTEIRGDILLSTATGRRVTEFVCQASQVQQQAAKFVQSITPSAARAAYAAREGNHSIETLNQDIAVVRAKPARGLAELAREQEQSEKHQQQVMMNSEKAQNEVRTRWKAQAEEEHCRAMLRFDNDKRAVATQLERWAAMDESIANAAKQLLVFVGTQAGLVPNNGVATSIAGEFDKSVPYIHEALAQCTGLRKTMAKVAALQFELPGTKSATEKARKFRLFEQPADEARNFQSESLNSAGANPGYEEVAVELTRRAVEEMKNKATGAVSSVKQGISQCESVITFAKNINENKRQMFAAGATDQEAKQRSNPLFAEHNVAADMHDRNGLVAGFSREGIDLGAFEWFNVARSSPVDFEAQQCKKYKVSDDGRANHILIAEEVKRAEPGTCNEAIKHRIDIAEMEPTKSGPVESFGMGDIKGGISHFLGSPGEREILIRQQVPARACAQLGEVSRITDNTTSLSGGPFEAAMRELVRRIEEEHIGGIYRGQFGGEGEQVRNTKALEDLTTTLNRLVDGGVSKPGIDSVHGPRVPSASASLTAPPPRPPQRM